METKTELRVTALLKRVKAEDFGALYELLSLHLKEQIIRAMNEILHTDNNFLLEKYFSDFYSFLTTPTKKGQYRLRNLDLNGAVAAYFSKTARNWLRSRIRKEIRFVSLKPEVPVQDDEDNTTETALELERKDWALVMAIERLADLPLRERYVLLTYLLSIMKKEKGVPLYVSKRLSQQLNRSEAAIKMSISRNLEMIREYAKQFI